MIFAPIPDFPCIRVLPPDRLTGERAAVLTQDPNDELTLRLLARHMGEKLLLQECWSRSFPRCGVLISSAISGGTMTERLQEAAARYPGRCWLLAEPVLMTFPLPCPTGTGTPIRQRPDTRGFFSESLLCQYTHFVKDHKGFMTLWDTEETMRQKLLLAKELGFLGYARLPETEDIDKPSGT